MQTLYADGAHGSGWQNAGNVAGDHPESFASQPLSVAGATTFKTLLLSDMIYGGNAYGMLHSEPQPNIAAIVETLALSKWPYSFSAGMVNQIGIELAVIAINSDGNEASPLRIGWTTDTLAALDDAAVFQSVDIDICHDPSGELRIHRASLNFASPEQP